MVQNSKQVYSDEQLREASKYLVYHVRMYVDTLLWLQEHGRPDGWDVQWNAILEAHLVHARLLSEFVIAHTRKRGDDVIALDYFHDQRDRWMLPPDIFLRSERDDIGGHLVHMTLKGDPIMKSERGWATGAIASELVPILREFFDSVPETRLASEVASESIQHLTKIFFPNLPQFSYAST